MTLKYPAENCKRLLYSHVAQHCLKKLTTVRRVTCNVNIFTSFNILLFKPYLICAGYYYSS